MQKIMSPLACYSLQSNNSSAINYNSSANACPHDYAKDYTCIGKILLNNPQLCFCQGEAICIICHFDFDAEKLLKVFLHWLSVHSNRVAILHCSKFWIMNARCSDANYFWFKA